MDYFLIMNKIEQLEPTSHRYNYDGIIKEASIQPFWGEGRSLNWHAPPILIELMFYQ